MKRVSRACQQCRSKHIKCNGRSPCSRCIAHAELHNISPTEICLYPEPKKRGRPSAGTSAHHSHHSSSHTSSSVAKKKLNSTNRVKVLSASSSPSSVSSITRRQTSSANTSPTPNVINLQQQQQQQQPPQTRWQKTSIVPQSESVVYWNANEAVQVPSYVLPQQISISHPGQMPITMADLVSQHLNFNFISNYDYGYLNQGPQPQPRVITLNAANASSLPSHTPTALIPQNSIMSSNNANTCYRQAYPNNNNSSNNSNSNGTRASSNNNNNNNNNNNSNRDNSYHSPNSHHYHLNRPYHAHLNYSAALSTSNNGFFSNECQ